MDISMNGVSAATSALAGARTGDAVGVLVMKKALDLQAQGAAALVAALPQPQQAPSRAGLPAHVGSVINTTA